MGFTPDADSAVRRVVYPSAQFIIHVQYWVAAWRCWLAALQTADAPRLDAPGLRFRMFSSTRTCPKWETSQIVLEKTTVQVLVNRLDQRPRFIGARFRIRTTKPDRKIYASCPDRSDRGKGPRPLNVEAPLSFCGPNGGGSIFVSSVTYQTRYSLQLMSVKRSKSRYIRSFFFPYHGRINVSLVKRGRKPGQRDRHTHIQSRVHFEKGAPDPELGRRR